MAFRTWSLRAGVSRAALLAWSILGISAATAQSISRRDLLTGLADPAQWLMYSGDYAGTRHSPLKTLTVANVATLALLWSFETGISGQKFETTPLVSGGVVYATGPFSTAWAIDARTGRELWRYRRTLPDGARLRLCCGPVNRGFAASGDRLFMTTLDAHLIALDRRTGAVVWDVELADWRTGHSSTVAPLVVNGKVIAGISGGEYGVRGFLDAYDESDGRRIWRFWTIPGPGEAGSETWPPTANQRGGGPTWVTGTFDPLLNVLFWGTGNPSPDFVGVDRRGDNLYTNSLVALDAERGTLRWYFQFTPHDEHDWDANHVPVLADLTVAGKSRKVAMIANRNGFYYVLDRVTGEFLHASAFVRQTWADGIAANGRPRERAHQRPTASGMLTCPGVYGGTNFMSPSFDPSIPLFVVTAREVCHVFVADSSPPTSYTPGQYSMAGRVQSGPDRGWGALRALDPRTGELRWELRHRTPSWAGVLSTAGGVVFTGDNEGHLLAVDSRTGRELWRHSVGGPVYAAPVTYEVDGRQYVVIAAGSKLTAFGLPRGGFPR